ncbi:MAG: TRAP transporter small permease [bacterium]
MPQKREFIERLLLVGAGFFKVLRMFVFLLAIIAGIGILTMIGVTCLDVIMRMFRHPLVGAFDIVKVAGTVTIAAALPYTTAVKGHVAIEYFFQKLSRRSRIFTDTFVRMLGILLFSFISRQSLIYAAALKRSGEVTLTLQIPVFLIMYFIAFCFALVALVIFYNLLHPGREMIKP